MMTRSIPTIAIASILATGLFFLPAAYANHPHDAPGSNSGSGMMGDGGMMGNGGMMEMMHMMMGMGGMMGMMEQMNKMMELCNKMMASTMDGTGSPGMNMPMDAPAAPEKKN